MFQKQIAEEIEFVGTADYGTKQYHHIPTGMHWNEYTREGALMRLAELAEHPYYDYDRYLVSEDSIAKPNVKKAIALYEQVVKEFPDNVVAKKKLEDLSGDQLITGFFKELNQAEQVSGIRSLFVRLKYFFLAIFSRR